MLQSTREKICYGDFTPLEKATDKVGGEYKEADGGSMPPSAYTGRKLRSLTGFTFKEGYRLGDVESFRGPVLFWIKLNNQGLIERCKIVDPSFHNWQGLSFAVLGNIIPDFPLCNKSFNLSYSGNDL